MERLILKKTGTYADALEALGLASLLEDLGFRGVTLRDTGSEFSVSTANEVPSQDWQQPEPGYPYIWERSKEKEKPRFQWIVDYEEEKGKAEIWKKFEQSQKKSKGRAKRALEEQTLEVPPPPQKEYKTAAILASMRKGWNGDRELAAWIRERPAETLQWVQAQLISNNSGTKGTDISNTQILNPISGKGVNASKTEWRSPGSLPTTLIDCFAEWMKLRGVWTGMLLFRSDDDFKFFVIEPARISIGGLGTIKKELEDLKLWGGVRLDIEATLRCVEILIRHSDVLQTGDAAQIGLRRLTPRSVIAGFRQAYFKSLGTAAALMNDAMLPLPEWFAIETREDADDYLAILAEAIGSLQGGLRTAGCLGSLEEKNSDDGRILQQYRRWLLTGELGELLEFHHQFALHLMQRLSKDEWVKQFSTALLDRLILKSYAEREPMLKQVIEDEGFKSVARAIRNSTVYAIRLENREVQFGLAQRWKQKIRAGERDFVSELGEFVQAHNWEVTYSLKGKGHTVTTTDLDAVVNLIEQHGAELVGSLLLAYGYARAPKLEEGQPKDTEATAT